MKQLSEESSEMATSQQTAVWLSWPDAGTLTLQGPDRIDFLQRQTTNDLSAVGEGDVIRTVLTSPIARILDVFTILVQPDHLIVLPLPGYKQHTLEFLRSRIFFMDKVTIEDVTSQYRHYLVAGEGAVKLLMPDGDGIFSAGEWLSLDDLESGVMTFTEPGIMEPQFHLLVPAESTDQFEDRLHESGGTQISREDYEMLRIESGLPAAGHELVEEYTPFEVRLDDLVSDRKGCYTGQEVLARQVTHDKVTKRLVGLKLEGEVVAGDSLIHDGARVGAITSVERSGRFGDIALAVVKRPANTSGTAIEVQGDGGRIVKGEVVELPFTQ